MGDGASSEVRTMPDVADETAYYFNRNIPAVALISKGVRFPRGAWMRVANATVPAAQVEQMLAKIFPDLKGKVLAFASLTTDPEVDEFERSLP
jgi:hypothetical protein